MIGKNVLKHVDWIVTEEGAELRRNEVKRQQLKGINKVAAVGLQDNDWTASAFWRVQTAKRKGAREAMKAHMNEWKALAMGLKERVVPTKGESYCHTVGRLQVSGAKETVVQYSRLQVGLARAPIKSTIWGQST